MWPACLQDDYHSHIPKKQTGKVGFFAGGTHFENIVSYLNVCRREGIEVRVVKRGEYDEEVVRWADAIISAGGRSFRLFGHLGCFLFERGVDSSLWYFLML